VLESRLDPGPARLRYLDGMLGTLHGAGFDWATVGRAFMALDSHTYGFALQEQSWAFDPDQGREIAAGFAASLPADAYPNLLAMAVHASGPEVVQAEFTFGLDLLLDGLDHLRPAG
jgi:hypothetical protein